MSVCVGLYPLSESVPPEPDPTEEPPHSSPSTIDLLHFYHIGTSVGSGSGGTDSESGYKSTQTDILSFIHQCVQCGKDQVSL
jgi:hypothetical protein